MKKLIYILIGIFTFSVGFWLYSLRPLVVPVSLCEISRHSEIYQAKQIHIKAYLDGVGINEDDLDFSVSDFSGRCLTGASLILPEQTKERLRNNDGLNSIINELRQKKRKSLEERDDSGFYLAEIEIVGEIESYKETDTAGLIEPPPYLIKVSEIKQISSVLFISREKLSNLTNLK